MKPTLTFNFNSVEELMEFAKKLLPPTMVAADAPSSTPVTRYAKGYNGDLPEVPKTQDFTKKVAKTKQKKSLSVEDVAPEVAPIEDEMPEEKSSISVKEISKDECRELLVQVSEKIGMPKTLELLKEFGAKKFGEVPTHEYGNFKARCESLL